MQVISNNKSNLSFQLLNRFGHSFLLWENPFSAALLSFIIFIGIASINGVPWRVTVHPYYNYLADAFLHGQLNLRVIPPSTLDLSLFNGKYYLYWGFLPAVTVMPLVLIFEINLEIFSKQFFWEH